MKQVLGIDLGGTNIRGAVVSEDGKILSRKKVSTEVALGKEKVVLNLLNLIESLSASPLSAIGIGVPGIILSEQGVVVTSPNFPDWVHFNLKSKLESQIQCQVILENDANAAALGEGWLGAGKDCPNYCVLTLGTGIGGGVVLNGKIWRGSSGMAGELGHINIYPDGRPCGCGNRGCMEQYASASGIVKEALSGIETPEAEKMNNFMKKGNSLTAHAISQLAQEGDSYALQVLEKAGRILGIGITNLINILNVDLFILGGGAAEAWPFFIDSLKKEILQRAYKYTAERVTIKKAELGDDAGIVGAASLALQLGDDQSHGKS